MLPIGGTAPFAPPRVSEPRGQKRTITSGRVTVYVICPELRGRATYEPRRRCICMPTNRLDGKAPRRKQAMILGAMPDDEPVIASEVADALSFPRSTVHYHLNRLAEGGAILKKEFHETRVVWQKPSRHNSDRVGSVVSGENVTNRDETTPVAPPHGDAA